MAVTRTSRRARNTPAPEPEATLTEASEGSENTDVSTDTVEQTESLNVDSESADNTEKPRREYKRPTEAIEARRRIAEYKKAEEARTLLTGLGFTVTQPEGWEHPDKVNERERAKRALAAYLAAGGSVDDLTGNGSEESTASEA